MPNFEMPTPPVEQPKAKEEKPGFIQSIKDKLERGSQEREIKKIEKDLQNLTEREQEILSNPRGGMTAEKIRDLQLIQAAKKASQEKLNQLKGVSSTETAEEVETENRMAA